MTADGGLGPGIGTDIARHRPTSPEIALRPP
jgi:hypothetical protein